MGIETIVQAHIPLAGSRQRPVFGLDLGAKSAWRSSMQKRSTLPQALIILALLFGIRFGPAAAEQVDLLLVLAADVSRSMDEEEWKLQRDGYYSALTNPRVVEAMRSGPNKRIALTYMEWSSEAYQRVLVEWRVIGDQHAAQDFADAMAEFPYVQGSWTSISSAIDFAAKLLDRCPHVAPRRVIDVSGDGRNNQGRDAWQARDDAVAKGITINGLPIINDRPNFPGPPELDLEKVYEREVIGGPGAFLIVAERFSNFSEAILAKLIKEVAWIPERGRWSIANEGSSPATSAAPVPPALRSHRMFTYRRSATVAPASLPGRAMTGQRVEAEYWSNVTSTSR
jgi:hypothetical protein